MFVFARVTHKFLAMNRIGDQYRKQLLIDKQRQLWSCSAACNRSRILTDKQSGTVYVDDPQFESAYLKSLAPLLASKTTNQSFISGKHHLHKRSKL
jgi:hypothetical protein